MLLFKSFVFSIAVGWLFSGAIAQGKWNVEPWSEQAPEEQGLSPKSLDRVAQRIGKIGWRQCFVVIKKGKLVYERYYSGDANTPVYAFSLTKSFVSALVGVAVSEGILSLDERLIDLKVPLAPSMHSNTRVRHLLGQVSEGPEPGQVFRYDSGNVVNSLSLVLDSALKRRDPQMDVVTYAQQHLFEPLGLHHTHWDILPRKQIRVGYGIRTSGRDAARLGQLFLNQGKWRGKSLVDASYVSSAIQASYPSANGAHGYLWWLNKPVSHWIRPVMKGSGQLIPGAPDDLFMATGMMGNFIYVFPSQDMVIVSLGHTFNWRIESLLTAREIYQAFAELL